MVTITIVNACNVVKMKTDGVSGFHSPPICPLWLIFTTRCNNVKQPQVKCHLFQGTLVPFADLLLLVSFHLLVVEVLGGTLDVVKAEFCVLLRLAGVVGQVAVHIPGPVWLTVLQPRKQLRRSLYQKMIAEVRGQDVDALN